MTLPTGQTIPNAWSTYRVFKEHWNGTPAAPPTAVVQPTSTDHWTVSAAWNGATGVSTWLVLAGPSRANLRPAATERWNGLITPIDLTGTNIRFVRVIALSQTNRPLGSSATLSVGS